MVFNLKENSNDEDTKQKLLDSLRKIKLEDDSPNDKGPVKEQPYSLLPKH